MDIAKLTIRYNKFLLSAFQCSKLNKFNLRLLSSKGSYEEFISSQFINDETPKLNEVKSFNVTNIANKYSVLYEVPHNLISNNYELCKENDITEKIIFTYPDILGQAKLKNKILILKECTHNINNMVPLLRLHNYKLLEVVKKINKYSKKKVTFLSSLLKVPEHCIYSMSLKKPFLLDIDLRRAKDNIELLCENGVTRDEILRDIWVLRYKTDTIRKRIEYAEKCDIDKFKTWMIRATEAIFLNYVKIRSDNKQILGNNSLVEYLAEKLNCTLDEASSVVLKKPALNSKSMAKMQEMINLLYAEGFQPNHILRIPKILLYSVETVNKRLRELEKLGVKLDSLYVLTQSQRQYKKYYNTFVTKNNRQKSM